MILLLAFTVFLATLLFLVFLLNQQVKFVVFVLEFVSTIVDLISLPIFLFIDQPWKAKLPSASAERHYEPNGNYYYWQAIPDCEKPKLSEGDRALQSSLKKLSHLSELLGVLGKVHKGKRCLGTRKILSKKIENGESKFELSGDYEWRSYEQVLDTIGEFAKALHHRFRLKRGDRVAIFAETSPEFFIMFFACQTLGCEVVLLRTMPHESSISFLLHQNQVELVLTQTSFVPLLNKLKPNIPTVARLICFRHAFANEPDEEELRNTQYELFEYDQLLKEARHLPEIEKRSDFSPDFSPDDIACVLNTSGSSGLPKSVLVTHANWIAFVAGPEVTLGLTNESTFLAYVEGSMIVELTREIIYFICGVKIAFGSKGTLLTGSRLLANGCLGDLAISEATHTIGFPLMLEHIRSSIQSWLRSQSVYLAAVYEFAYRYKRRWTGRHFQCRLMDVLLFGRVKSRFSQRLTYVCTGGAPLRLETGIFLKLHLNLEIGLCYGSTEASGIALSSLSQFGYANALSILPGVKLRLDDWEEGGYRVNDQPNARGEVIIGSDTVSAGYYLNEEATTEAFFDENGIRWWRSGDIGEINEFGQVTLIDRKSNFAKSQTAYHIAMGKVESILRSCRFVENIVIHVSPYADYVTAIVSPNEESIRELAKELAKDANDLSALYQDADMEKAVVDELVRFGTANGLIPMELPAQVRLVPEKWTPASGLVTETLKTRRKPIYAFYRDSIKAMYRSV